MVRRRAVCVLLAVHNAYTAYTSGAAREVHTLMLWLAVAGHGCRVLCAARCDGRPPLDVLADLRELAIACTTAHPRASVSRELRRHRRTAHIRYDDRAMEFRACLTRSRPACPLRAH